MFLTDITSQGWVGVAYVGVLCGSKQSRVSISAYYSNDIYTAEVIRFSCFIEIMMHYCQDTFKVT